MEKSGTLLADLTYTVVGDFDNSGINLQLHIPQRNDYIFGRPIDISNNNLNAIIIGMKTADGYGNSLLWQKNMPLYRLNPITSLSDFGDSTRFNPNLQQCFVVIYHDLTIDDNVIRSFYDRVPQLYQNYNGPRNMVWPYDPHKEMAIPKRAGMTIITRRP